MNKYNIFGMIIGIIYICLVFGNNAGEPHNLPFNFGSLIQNGSLYIGGKHIHHWLISLIILFYSIPYQIKTKSKIISVLNGFLVIMFFQGISYKDWLDF
ncbi:hypothetical protein CPAV1605_704 [seawater metagenome]|uniref:Uncharacterized protein n=1 Tax=seawater metagenome TaxID=1561972 RepID=A0A5E8CK09_9ZZZZ